MEARHSRPSRPTGSAGSAAALYSDQSHKADLESRNALLQFDEIRSLAAAYGGALQLTSETLCDLQRIAIQDIYVCAGTYRDAPVCISGTPHEPPDHADVPQLVAAMCEYANGVGDRPIHASSYLMWRLNWIHPFSGGNGRTARAVSYLAMCVGFGMDLPGTLTVPDLIVENRQPYYDALDAADAAWGGGNLDVSKMEQLLGSLLQQQLETAV